MIACADREEVYETLRFSAEVLPRFSTSRDRPAIGRAGKIGPLSTCGRGTTMPGNRLLAGTGTD